LSRSPGAGFVVLVWVIVVSIDRVCAVALLARASRVVRAVIAVFVGVSCGMVAIVGVSGAAGWIDRKRRNYIRRLAAPVVIRGLRIFGGGVALVRRVWPAVVVSHNWAVVVINQVIRSWKMES
jgi:hypothetical protein